MLISRKYHFTFSIVSFFFGQIWKCKKKCYGISGRQNDFANDIIVIGLEIHVLLGFPYLFLNEMSTQDLINVFCF